MLLFKAQATQLWRQAVRVGKGIAVERSGVSPMTVDREEEEEATA